MDPMKLSIISIIISSVGTLIIGVTAFILWWQIRSNHEWNRRKATQETLDKLVTGEFPEFRKKLEVDLTCSIWKKDENYKSCTDPLSEEVQGELDDSLARILNFFETIGINIKNNIIDENICYDYLGWLYTEYLRWSQPFIDERRNMAGDPRVLINFTNYAEKWSKRIEEERKEIQKGISIPGKSKL